MVDGNGRGVSRKTGRLLLNGLLLQAGFPLTVIHR
jgi:Fic family protein